MAYNPAVHKRRSIRLKGYDYSQEGVYFITICCHEKECRFGRIEQAEMILNEFGEIAAEEWEQLPGRFPSIEPDIFQIMPNHMHAIFSLRVGAPLAGARNTDHNNGLQAPTVGDIAGAYKSLVANSCLEIYKSRNEGMGKLWQRNYYEHIIRDRQSYERIYEYILTNPARWQDDKFYKP